MRPKFAALAQSLTDIRRQLGQAPKAVLMISGHWEEDAFSVMANPRPPMLYDYYGFPAQTYRVQYPAAGSPDLARRVAALIRSAGHAARLDAERGYDHGTFTPMAVMYPQADMPLVQLSLKAGLDPAEHLALGRALAPLRDEGILIVGSGASFHNLRLMGPGSREPSAAFDAWLQQAVVASPPEQRAAHLVDWRHAPAARLAHPREDHLLPLMVAAGAAGAAPASRVYHEDRFFGHVSVSSFRFD